MDTYFKGTWRMDWGLGNPNKTAALIAGLMISVWFLAGVKKWGFWVALSLFTSLGFALIHTFSRGGLFSLIAGLCAVTCGTPRRVEKAKIYALIGSILALIIFTFYLKAADRFTSGIVSSDLSITNRLQIWKVAPRMMVDAPDGWGLGNAGSAYMQWYQPLEDSEGYRTLVNSHLTWMVELSWPLRVSYLLAWSTAFAICWPRPKNIFLSICLGCMISIGTACFFSSVGESPWVWIAPVVSLFVALTIRIRAKVWPAWQTWLSFYAAVPIILGVILVSGIQANPPINYQANVVSLGTGPIRFWILPNDDILGKYFGKGLRKIFKNNENSFCISTSDTNFNLPENLVFDKDCLLVVAKLNENQIKDRILFQWISSGRKVLLINPWVYSDELINLGQKKSSLTVWMGEFSGSPVSVLWLHQDQVPLTTIAGIRDFSLSWLEKLTTPRVTQ